MGSFVCSFVCSLVCSLVCSHKETAAAQWFNYCSGGSNDPIDGSPGFQFRRMVHFCFVFFRRGKRGSMSKKNRMKGDELRGGAEPNARLKKRH